MTLKYIFTGDDVLANGEHLYGVYRSKVFREPILAELPEVERRVRWEEYGEAFAPARWRMDLEASGKTAQECAEIGTMLFRLGYPLEAILELSAGRAHSPHEPLAHAFKIVGNDYRPMGVEDRFADLDNLKRFCGIVKIKHSPRRYTLRSDNDAERVLRVAYLSGDFYRHSAFNTWYALLREHDRAQFHVTGYYTGAINDDYTMSARVACDAWRQVTALEDDALCQLIRDDEIDILIDLAGLTAGNRLKAFARHPALLQACAFAFIEGNASGALDWHWGDEILVTAEEAKAFDRPMEWIPSAFFYEAPADAPSVADAPSLWNNGRITFGCFNKSDKVNDECLSLWKKILDAVPGSKLILKCPWYDDASVRLRMAERVQLLGYRSGSIELYGASKHAEHLQFYDDIDIALDTFPHNGGTTTGETLWAGVPVVTLYGNAPPGRMSAAMLYRTGLGGMIARTPEEYVQIAVLLAADPAKLQSLRHSMRARLAGSIMFNAPDFVRSIEEAYRRQWKKFCSNPNHERHT